jgi:hypothetical protein
MKRFLTRQERQFTLGYLQEQYEGMRQGKVPEGPAFKWMAENGLAHREFQPFTLARRSWEEEVLSLHRKRSTLLLGLQLRSSAGEPPNWTKLCTEYSVKPELKTTSTGVHTWHILTDENSPFCGATPWSGVT